MSVLWRLGGYMRPHLPILILGAVVLAVSGLLASMVVATMKPLVNEVLLPPSVAAAAPAATTEVSVPADEDPFAALRAFFDVKKWLPEVEVTDELRQRAYVFVPLVIVIIFLLRSVFLYLGTYWVTAGGIRVIRDLRAALYSKILRQSASFFRDNPPGAVLSRVLSDVQRLQQVTTTTLGNFVRVAPMVPLLLIMILVFDWRMSVFAMVVLPLMVYPTLLLGKRLRRASRRSQEALGEVANLTNEAVTGIKVVQGFAMEDFENRQFAGALGRLMRIDHKAARAAALAPAVIELVGAVAGAALFYLAGRAIARGSLDLGNFTVVIAGLGLLFAAIRRLTRCNVEVQTALAAAQRVFEVLDEEIQVRDAPGAHPLATFSGELRFEGLEFAYGSSAVLRGIDLTIPKGQMVALVGPSGAGKTTLVNLIPRFIDPTGGRLLLDGHDLREVTLVSLRQQIGLVTQETILFDGSVRSNIAYGSDEIALERVVAAARAANADEFIRELPDGYDTQLGERATRLSMGQRQRLSIARALLKDPPILILDEATSALDSESERLVQQALDHLLEGRTSIVIAHRLSTIRRADRILTMQAGRIVEEGTHHELLAADGLYARLHALQFEEPPDTADEVTEVLGRPLVLPTP
jgi:subfamily B ATP-binding cassette protein MsbA